MIYLKVIYLTESILHVLLKKSQLCTYNLWCPTRLCAGPLLFLLYYINDMVNCINDEDVK